MVYIYIYICRQYIKNGGNYGNKYNIQTIGTTNCLPLLQMQFHKLSEFIFHRWGACCSVLLYGSCCNISSSPSIM